MSDEDDIIALAKRINALGAKPGAPYKPLPSDVVKGIFEGIDRGVNPCSLCGHPAKRLEFTADVWRESIAAMERLAARRDAELAEEAAAHLKEWNRRKRVMRSGAPTRRSTRVKP